VAPIPHFLLHRDSEMELEQTEKHIQRTVADHLDRLGLLWTHVPNEEKALSVLKREVGDDAFFAALSEIEKQGRKKGVPDVLIFDTPPNYDKKGVALELKSGEGVATDDQEKWVNQLTERGWLCAITHGVDETVNLIEKAGYTE